MGSKRRGKRTDMMPGGQTIEQCDKAQQFLPEVVKPKTMKFADMLQRRGMGAWAGMLLASMMREQRAGRRKTCALVMRTLRTPSTAGFGQPFNLKVLRRRLLLSPAVWRQVLGPRVGQCALTNTSGHGA